MAVSRNKLANPTDKLAPPEDSSRSPQPIAHPEKFSSWWIGGIVLACWWGFLLWLIYDVSRNDTFSEPQLLHSDLVVSAIIQDSSEGRIKVTREWKSDLAKKGSELIVTNLSLVESLSPREQYIFPLSKSDADSMNTYKITPMRFRITKQGLQGIEGSPPVIYSVHQANETRLNQLLDRLKT